MFILWIIVNKKNGSKILPPIDKKFIALGATMSQGYSIHNMMIPVILRSKNPKNYKKILGNDFIYKKLMCL